MTYKINSTPITLQPTTGRWIDKDQLALDGNLHPIYPAFRSFELKWDLVDASDLNQLQTFFDNVGITGSVVATLPKHSASTYLDFDYTGCVLSEPSVNTFFEQHTSQVTLIVSRIRT